MNKLYLFTFIFLQTSFATQAQFNLADLKDAAIDAAIIRKNKAEAAGFTAEAQTLATEIAALEAATLAPPIIPDKAIGFFPVTTITTDNPHLEFLYRWAESYLAEVEPNYEKSSTTSPVFTGGKFYETRDLVSIVEKLIWLSLSPQSRYQYHPVLLKRLLLISFATSDDYLLNGGDAFGEPESNNNALDDWFASPGAIYSWKIVATSFQQYIPPFLIQRFEQAADKITNQHYGLTVTQMGATPPYRTYCNRDISYAEVLIHGGQYRNNALWLNRGLEIVNLVLGPTILFPDGAYSYIGNQNEGSNYHGATTISLAKLYSVTGQSSILTGIANAKNYELLNIEEGFINEFYHVPAWKTQWNGGTGISGVNLLYISKSPHWKTLYEINRSVNGGLSDSPLDVSFYDGTIPTAPLPNNYLVYDRNIQGPKRRINDFSYGITTRKVSLPNNLGHLTLAGAMTTTSGGKSRRELDAALMSMHAKVHVSAGNTTEWDKWAYLMGDMDPLINMSKSISSVSTPTFLYRQTAGPTAHTSQWASFQQWVTLPDRMIGLVEVYPKGTSNGQAYEVDGRIKLGYGRTGILNPKDMEIVIPGSEYNYGNIKILIHQHDFTSVDTVAAGVVRDWPKEATEIRFRYDLSNNGSFLAVYPNATRKHFIAEIRYKEAIGNVTVERYNTNNVKGLIITSGNNKYATFRNLGTTSAIIDVSSYLTAGHTNKVHYSRTDNIEPAPTIFTGTSLTIPANQQRLLVSSNNLLDNQQSWENFNVLLDQLPGIRIQSANLTHEYCAGDLISFTTLTDNLGSNTTFQWNVDDVPVVGATNATFSSNTLTDQQSISCTMTTTLTDGSSYQIKSNILVVTVSAKPSLPVLSTTTSSLFTGNYIYLQATVAGATTTTTYEWRGPNQFISTLQNPIISNATLSDSGTYTVVAGNERCFSDPASIQISTTNTHVWRGTADSNYGNDANWDFGFPKFNIGHVVIDKGVHTPIINSSSSFSAPSMEVKKDAPLEITGFFSVGNINTYVSKASFTFNDVQSANLVGKTLTGTYEYKGTPTSPSFEFRWYRADNKYGNNAILIGTNQNYTLTTEDVDKFIAFSARKLNSFGGVESVKTSEFIKITKVNAADDQALNATVLLSFRQLRKTYTGPLLRVRREKDNREMDIPFTSSGYLDQDILVRFSNYGNVYVSVWYDQSGNGLNAVQVDKNKQPFIVKGGKIVTNNFLPAFEFLGSQILEVPSSPLLDAPLGFALFLTGKQMATHTATEYRTSMAYRTEVTSTTSSIGGSAAGTYGFRNIRSAITSPSNPTRQVIGFMLNSSAGILSSGTVSFSNYRDFANQSIQLTNYCNGGGNGNNFITVNNNQFSVLQTLALEVNPINGPFTIGNRNLNQSQVHFIIGEVILYNQPISATQRDEIEKNMMKLN